jgi:hypothetical protein
VPACILGTALAATASAQQVVWSSGFENGFPGEFLNYNDGGWTASGTMPAGRVSAWTITRTDNGVTARSGSMYKGWITAATSEEAHRAYPSLHLDARTPAVNTFYAYVDADFSRWGEGGWVHLATYGNVNEWALQTMTIRNGQLVFAHTNPFEGEYIGPSPRQPFPLRRWVRLTVYLRYEGSTGFTQAWVDGVPWLRASVSPQLGRSPGTNLQRAHWGMYAESRVDRAVQYNDEIVICTLAAPLTDLVREPTCGSQPTTSRPRPPTNVAVN